MKRHWMMCGVLVCFVLTALQHSRAQAPAQAGTPLPSAPESARNAHPADRRIDLTVTATDSSGKPVLGLQQQDFTVLDNGQPQKMLSFTAVQGPSAEPPVQLILLIDLVNTSFSRVAFVRQELDRFLRQNNGQLPYPTSLVIFTDTGAQIQPQPSRDGNELANMLGSTNSSLRIIGRSAGFYGAEERIQASYQTLDRLISYESQKPGRKLLVWISPGWPLLEGPSVEYGRKQQQTFYDWIARFNNAIRAAHMTLYAVNPIGAGDESMLRTFYYQSYLKGVRNVNQAGPGNLALQVLAEQSGGRVLNSSNDVLSEFNACVADASAFYEMSFEAAPSDKVNEYHAITVKVDKPGVKIRTSAAYYGQP